MGLLEDANEIANHVLDGQSWRPGAPIDPQFETVPYDLVLAAWKLNPTLCWVYPDVPFHRDGGFDFNATTGKDYPDWERRDVELCQLGPFVEEFSTSSTTPSSFRAFRVRMRDGRLRPVSKSSLVGYKKRKAAPCSTS